MKNIITILSALAFMLTACTKEVKMNLKTTEPQIVIEGDITNQPGPYTVLISKTVNFTNSNTYPPVSGAVVTIADDNGFTETLTEMLPGVYKTAALTGTPGRTYTLRVTAGGKNFTATSTMPVPVTLDAIQFDLFTSKGNSGGPEYSTLPVFTDPQATINSYRFIQTVNGKRDNEYFVLNDNTFNGQKNDQVLFNPDAEIKTGDTVDVEFRCIDSSTYLYFYTLSQFNSDGPYNTTPTNPPGNIKGDAAFGIFSAYTVERKSAVVGQ